LYCVTFKTIPNTAQLDKFGEIKKSITGTDITL